MDNAKRVNNTKVKDNNCVLANIIKEDVQWSWKTSREKNNIKSAVEVSAEDIGYGGNKKGWWWHQCVSKYIGGECHKDKNDFQGEEDITDQDDGWQKGDEHRKVVENVKKQDKINFFNNKKDFFYVSPIQRQNDIGVRKDSLLFEGIRHKDKDD